LWCWCPYNDPLFSGTFALSASGDQIIVFQDATNPGGSTSAASNPRFIFASNNASTDFNGDRTDTNETGLPTGLNNTVAPVSALGLGSGSGPDDEFDNVVYNGSYSFTSIAEAKLALTDPMNYTQQNSITDPTYETAFIGIPPSLLIIDPAPTVAIASSESSPTGEDMVPITIIFSEDVTGFDATDINITNGTLSDFNGSGDTYTANLTPFTTPITITVNIAANVAIDTGNNGNLAATPFSIEFDNVLSIEDQILTNGLDIYPNPSSNNINVSGAASLALERMEIFDITGKLIFSQKLNVSSPINTIDISTMPSGLYLMTVYSERASATKRLMKQ